MINVSSLESCAAGACTCSWASPTAAAWSATGGARSCPTELDPGFQVGFNSLGGLASANHLYLAHPLPVEGAPSTPLDPKGCIHLLQALPAPGFLFYTSGPGPDLGALISRVCGATDYLSDCEIVHN